VLGKGLVKLSEAVGDEGLLFLDLALQQIPLELLVFGGGGIC
jgi:hypothetical protein